MLGFPTQKQYILAPISLILIVLVLELMKPLSIQWVVFTTSEILNGEIWRIITGQLLHTNFNHVLLNLGGLILIWALHGEYYDTKHYILAVFTSLILVGAGLLWFAPYNNYAGLSGILHSLIVYGGFLDIKKGDKTGWLLLLGVLAKILYESIAGPAEYTKELIDASVAVEAHLIGCIVGVLMGLGYLYIYRKTNSPSL
jgi:rhomboid family GlyGly-CTERM serine protease